MSHAVIMTIVAAMLLATLVGCAPAGSLPGTPAGTPPGGPGSVTTYLHGQTAVTFGVRP